MMAIDHSSIALDLEYSRLSGSERLKSVHMTLYVPSSRPTTIRLSNEMGNLCNLWQPHATLPVMILCPLT